jgi:hypothetical protein
VTNTSDVDSQRNGTGEMPEGDSDDRCNAVYQRFSGGWDKIVEGKYPATE